MIQIPILLTLARIIIVPFLVLAILRQDFTLALQLFIIAGITDLLDGLLARLLRQETQLGAALDPIADKLLIVATYGALISVDNPYFTIPTWFIVLVVVRELCILAGAWHWSHKKQLVPLAPTKLGKITMALQLIFISFLMCSLVFETAFPHLFSLLLAVVSASVILSLLQYGYLVLRKVRRHGL